jgi:hypothetical protein
VDFIFIGPNSLSIRLLNRRNEPQLISEQRIHLPMFDFISDAFYHRQKASGFMQGGLRLSLIPSLKFIAVG